MNEETTILTEDAVRDIARGVVNAAFRDASTLDILRPVLAEMVHDRWITQSYPVMSSLDLTTRSIETALGNIYHRISEINGSLGAIKSRLDAHEERLDEVDSAIKDPEKGLNALHTSVTSLATRMTTLHNTIHGDPNERSGNLSLFERLDQQDRDRNSKHAELMNETSTLVKRVEKVEDFVARRQAIESRIVDTGKKLLSGGWALLHDWKFWLAVLGTGGAIVAALLAGQQPPPSDAFNGWWR